MDINVLRELSKKSGLIVPGFGNDNSFRSRTVYTGDEETHKRETILINRVVSLFFSPHPHLRQGFGGQADSPDKFGIVPLSMNGEGGVGIRFVTLKKKG